MTIKELKDFVSKQKNKWNDPKFILQDLREHETIFDWFQFELNTLVAMIKNLEDK
jgi:hypothetical protein